MQEEATNMKTQPNTSNKQAGFVSLFTVIFFMLLITVITVGFLRIMGIEQQQSLDNDLSASALRAAESGVEDGKRAVLSYLTTTNSSLKTALGAAMNNNTQCDALTSSPTIRTALNLDAAGNVIGNSQLNQYYSCLSVNLKSPNYINSSNAGKSDYIPLVTDDPNGFETMKVSWHLISSSASADGDGIPPIYPNAIGTLLRPVVNTFGNPINSWSYWGYPAYLRVQLFGYPNTGSFTRSDLDARSRTLILIPSANAAAISENTPINFETSDPRGFNQSKVILQQIMCKPNPATLIGSYACAATLELPITAALRGTGNSYFLRITPIYGPTHFAVSMMHNGTPVNFNGVQPIIDSTGRAADVYRRIQSRVRINPPGVLPEFVVESANTICKNMAVSDGSFYLPNICP
jgi:hypothetical protein